MPLRTRGWQRPRNAQRSNEMATVETGPRVPHVATVHIEGRESASPIMRSSSPPAEVVAMSQGEDVLFLDSYCRRK